jgi:hypothetical protein
MLRHDGRKRRSNLICQRLPVGVGPIRSFLHVRFSNRPFGVKHLQTIHHCGVVLFGIGTRALPSWGSKTGWNNLLGGLAVRQRVGPSGHANSPHPSSREGQHSTTRWKSSFSPIIFDPVEPSCRHGLPGPAELGTVNPDSVHDHG